MSNYEQRPPYSEPEHEAIQELSNPQPATPPTTPPEEVVVVNTTSAGNNGNGSESQSANSNSPLKKRAEIRKELIKELQGNLLFELGIIKLKQLVMTIKKSPTVTAEKSPTPSLVILHNT